MQNKTTSGFTIIELMLTITIAAVLVTIATPSFRTLIENNRITKVSNEYATAFRLARSNALSKRLATFVCPSDNAGEDTPTCGADWTNGLIVYFKPPNTAVANAGTFSSTEDTLILQSSFGENTADSISVAINGDPGGFLGFSPEGFTWQAAAGGNATPTFVICSAERGAESGRAFSFSITGRIFIQDTNDADAPACA